jgi:hypothetical protein
MESNEGVPTDMGLDCALPTPVNAAPTRKMKAADIVRYNWPDKKTPREAAKSPIGELEAKTSVKGDLLFQTLTKNVCSGGYRGEKRRDSAGKFTFRASRN